MKVKKVKRVKLRSSESGTTVTINRKSKLVAAPKPVAVVAPPAPALAPGAPMVVVDDNELAFMFPK